MTSELVTIFLKIKKMFSNFFRSNHDEIKEFLISNEYLLIEITSPNKMDWKKSPFEKPPNFSIEIVVFRVNGRSVSSDYDYKLISVEDKNGKEILYWLEIKSGFLWSKTFTFKKSKVLKQYK